MSYVEALAASQTFFDHSTRCLEEKDSSFAPKEGMFTVAQQVAHAAQAIEWSLAPVFGDGWNEDYETLTREVLAVSSLAEARTLLDRAFARAREQVAGATEADLAQPLPPGPIPGPRSAAIDAAIEHTAHHRGALSVYSRLLGYVPDVPYEAEEGEETGA